MAHSHVAFLRGMNVGGHRVTNDELAACFADMGFASPIPYQASGNVLLGGVPPPDARRIEAGLEAALGYAVPTTLRTAAEVEVIAMADPFPGETKVQVMFLIDEPSPDLALTVARFASADDPLVVGTNEIFWLTRDGITGSAFDVRAFEQAVGTFTIRTKATVGRLAAKLG